MRQNAKRTKYNRRTKYNSVKAIFIVIISLIFIILLFDYSYKIKLIYNMETKEKQNVDNLKTQYNETLDKSENENCNNNYHSDKFSTYEEEKKDNKYNEGLINKNITSSYNDDKTKIKEESADCIIDIPDIDLSKIVYTGMSREKHLDNYELITAAPDMKFINGGNYIICGHASRLYGHSLNRLGELHKDSLIQIWCDNKVIDYIVKDVYFENMNDTDKYCKQTTQKEITIISCAKYISKESYIIIKAIPK